MPRVPLAVLSAVLIVLDLALVVALGTQLRGQASSPVEVISGGGGRDGFESLASAPAGAPTFSAFQSPVSFAAGRAASNSAVRAGHPVWVVTVEYPIGCYDCTMERPLRRHHAYSVVYDAHTGGEVDFCGGCELLTRSATETIGEHALATAPDWLLHAATLLLRSG